MKEEDMDIVELMINSIGEDTEMKQRIKLYMQTHKSNCNNFIYEKYSDQTTLFNTIFKSLRADLGAEIARTLLKDEYINI